MRDDGGLCTLTQGKVDLIAGYGHKPAVVELVDRLVRASAEPGCRQGLIGLEQR